MAFYLSGSFFRKAVFLAASGLLFMQGCGPDIKELEEKILAKDPSFKSVIEGMNAVRKELAAERASYLSKMEQIEGQIKALESKRSDLRRAHNSRMEMINKKLGPEKAVFEAELVEMKKEFRIRSAQIRTIEKNIKEINDLIEKQDILAMTQGEMRTWNERLASLILQKEELTAEKEKLAVNIEVTEWKIKVMSAR